MAKSKNNKYAEKNPGEKKPIGRPPFYTDPEVMQKKIDEYFSVCDEGEKIEVYDKKKQEVITITQKIPYTVPGLAYHLGFNGRQSFLDYAKNRKTTEITADEWEKIERFADAIKRAKFRIESQRAIQLLDTTNPVGKIFDLKNNFGWKDTTEKSVRFPDGVDITVSGELRDLVDDIVGGKHD